MPRRSSLLAANLLVVVAASAVAAVAVIAVCWLVGTVTRGEPLPLVQGPVPAVTAGYVFLVMLYGLLGGTLGQLTRSIPAAVAILLVTPAGEEICLNASSALCAGGSPQVLENQHDDPEAREFGSVTKRPSRPTRAKIPAAPDVL